MYYLSLVVPQVDLLFTSKQPSLPRPNLGKGSATGSKGGTRIIQESCRKKTERAEDLEKPHLKTFFTGSPMDHTPSAKYMKSIWRPLLNQIPQEVDRR